MMATSNLHQYLPPTRSYRHQPTRSCNPILFVLAFCISPSHCFSTPKNGHTIISRMQSIIIEHVKSNIDTTTIPIGNILCNFDGNISTISYASDFVPRQEISASAYSKFTQSRHLDCINLFDGYETKLIQCKSLDEKTINIRWGASWVPPGSTWLYNLADMAGWDVTRKSPDPTMIATFSWKSVFGMFQKAFATGNITLPVSSVEGNTVVSIGEKQVLSVKEAIDLVSEADKNRLQNRRVAQELASWIDVSRRPPEEEFGIDAEEWEGMVRQRVLTGVAGAGALDVDPNEDDAESAIALIIFGVITLGALALSFEYFIMPEIVGGTGTIPSKCDDAAILEFGSGYLSECFGPYGDPLY